MKHLFVPYSLAVLLKAKGFNDPCLTYYEPKRYDQPKGEQVLRSIIKTTHLNAPYTGSFPENPFIGYKNSVKEMFDKEIVAAPLYQQATDWLRTRWEIFISANNRGEHLVYQIWNKRGALQGESHIVISEATEREALDKAIEQALNLIQ